MNPVVVNGRVTAFPDQQCTRCVQDTTVPGITFDAEGICNFCDLHDRLEQKFPNDELGQARLQKLLRQIRKDSRGKTFDCLVGISGGRDSTALLYNAVKKWGLKPLAVHFNNGFDNPVAGENMVKACKILGVDLRTITSDWRESKDIRIAFLKASTPDLNLGSDLGIASALYGVATKEKIRHILIGQSFRTEGIKPLSWSYFDGDYLRAVHNIYGTVPLRKWQAEDPGFHLGWRELFTYSIVKGIRVHTPLYHINYIRSESAERITTELGWVYPGAHYFDDLYHSLVKYIHRVKFNIDLNINSDSALVRSGQMNRDEALTRAHSISNIEDREVIELCIKRLGLTNSDLDEFMALPPKTFRDYPTSYPLIRMFRPAIWLLCLMNFLPSVTYDKYFRCGK